MELFIFFALPIATILLAIVLQKILKCPILVGITFFAIYLIVAFAAFSSTLAEAIIATIVYSIIAFITAFIVQVICNLKRRLYNLQGRCANRDRDSDNTTNCCCRDEDTSNNLLRISYNCNNGQSNDLLTVNSTCGNNDNGNNNRSNNGNNNGNCNCRNGINPQGNDVAITANFVPCSNNNGRSGFVRGCYRRL